MTDLVKKEKLTVIFGYLAYSVILTYQNRNPISLVYFAAVALTIVFADRLFSNDFPVKKTLSAFFITAVGYQSLYGIFNSVHNDVKQIFSALAAAIFFACIFAFTDSKKLSLCIAAAPVLCILNFKTAICYCVFLLCIAVMKLCSADKAILPDRKNKSKKKELSKKSLAVISIVTGIICLGISCYLLATADGYVKENIKYLLTQFKNPPALIIASGYLAVKLFGSSTVHKAALSICLVLFVAATVITTVVFGWSLLAIFCLSLPLFLGILCIDDVSIVDRIKADYQKNKFLFFIIAVCALQ
ncbi:MAG: hypothetical protein IKJ69_01835 [Clostridia bacterium]|nr:hypothetical protein [Clostridia bacterium]